MSKKCFLFFAMMGVFSVKVSSQTFSYRTSLKDMCGDPGDVFACTISFTNTSASPINIYVDRYQKTTPAYWYSCFCYIQCNSPLRDTITINIPAFSTDMMVVQFKTDSVNPGLSIGDFTIYQIGFQNNLDSFQLIANTGCNNTVGLNKFDENANNIKLFPNPASDNINIFDEQNQFQNATIEIKNYFGQVVFNTPFINKINLSHLSAGMYFLTIQDRSIKKTAKIIKE